MENGSTHGSAHDPAHIIHLPSAQPTYYTAQQIVEDCAEICKVSEVTVRTRWFDWLKKVAPEPLLKEPQGFTELAHALFLSFAKVPKDQRQQWVAATKSHYAQEWSNDGILDGELLPEEVGAALATLKTQTSSMQTKADADRFNIETFIDQLTEVEASFSEAELQAFRTNGAKRGMARFKIETQAEVEVYSALQQRRLQGKQEQPPTKKMEGSK